MMTSTWELGEPIASRRLHRGDRAVVVTFGKPQAADGDYFCPVRIEGIDSEPKTRAIFGVDAVQALVLALDFAGRVLADDGEITWAGSSDLGSPHTAQ